MLHRVINGYTIVAAEYVPNWGYLVMGSKRESDRHTYVTAWMGNVDTDPEWAWGAYGGSDFHDSIIGASENFTKRLAN